jgi:hypothetical protein
MHKELTIKNARTLKSGGEGRGGQQILVGFNNFQKKLCDLPQPGSDTA